MKKILFVLIVALLVMIQFQTSNAAPAEMKEWTFLTFMNGHDEAMDPYTDANLESMQKVGSTDQINVVVQVASLEREQTERVYVKKGSHEIIEKLPRVDMGDYRELIKFIEWTVKNYPAKKYFINVWNHGTGWHFQMLNNGLSGGPKGSNDFQLQDISYDGLSGNHITTEEMGKVMKAFSELIGHKVELYGNDACLMAMIEVAAEVEDSVSYFASSQESEPLLGWPYDKLLERWARDPSMDGAEVGKILTEEYLKYYPTDEVNFLGTTFSIIDLSKLSNLMESLSNLRNELVGLGSEKAKSLSLLASGTHNFEDATDYKDLKDFIERLEKSATLGVSKSTLSEVQRALNDSILLNVNTESEERANGLSVWLPTYDAHYDRYIDRYRNLRFNKKTGWADLLDMLIVESGR